MKNNPGAVTFRKSHTVLILRLIVLEIILAITYLIIRVPKSLIIPSFLNLPDNQLLTIYGFVYFIVLSLVELIFVVYITLQWSNEEFEIREESIVHRKGIISLKQQTYTLRNLSSANVYQGLVGKILNFGTIVITSPILKNDVVLTDINNPQQVIALLEDNIDESNVKGANIIPRKY